MWRSGEDPEKETENEHTLMQGDQEREVSNGIKCFDKSSKIKKKKTIEFKNVEVFADHDKSSFSE